MLLAVTAVAQRLPCGGLAAAEEHFFALGGFVLKWYKIATLVRAVAEWLTGTFATGAPEIGLTGFDFYAKGCFGSSDGITHIRFPSLGLGVHGKTV
jgi:hypothetical protein